MVLQRMLVFYAIFAMTSSDSSGPFPETTTVATTIMAATTPPVAAISEVEIKCGSAHTTAFYNTRHGPEQAFILGSNQGWFMQSPYGMFPQMVWYEFPAGKTFVPARICFHPRQDYDKHLIWGPTIWQFIGSNDESCGKFGHWTVLCEDRSDAGYRNKFTTKYCDVVDKILSEFRCLGISVLGTHSNEGKASLQDVRMWKKVFH